MPHYANGEPARVGDVVKGKCFNTRGEILGVIHEVTPGSETCNCKVGILAVVHEEDGRRVVVPGSIQPGWNDYSQTDRIERVL